MAAMQDRSEGDINLGDARAAWQREYIDAETRALLDEDARWFLHQALSTPCLNVVERAEGIYLVDTAGRRIMDFHGNTVHQVGYGHPRVIEAVTRQLADAAVLAAPLYQPCCDRPGATAGRTGARAA